MEDFSTKIEMCVCVCVCGFQMEQQVKGLV